MTELPTSVLHGVHGGNRGRFLRGLADQIGDWLGPGARSRPTPNGASQYMSPGGERIIRFDLEPGQHKGAGPHINVQDRSLGPRHNEHVPVGP